MTSIDPTQLPANKRGRKRKRPLSDEQLVSQQVSQILAPLLADIQTRGERTQTNLSGIYEALAKAQEGVAPAIQQTYQTAASDTGAFAKGYGDAMKALLGKSAEAGNEILQQQGSPQQVQSGAGAADVLYGLQGSIPGQALTREGAGFTAAAQFLPSQARQLGAQAQAKSVADVDDAIREIEAKRPGLIQEALNELRQLQQAQQDYELKKGVAIQSGLYKEEQLRQGQERIGLGWANLRFQTAKDRRAAQKAAASGPKPAAELSKIYGYVVDADGNPILNEHGKRIRVKTSSGADVSGESKSVIIGRANDVGNEALDKLTDRIWANTPGAAEQGEAEPDDKYDERRAKAEAIYAKRLRNNWGSAMSAVIQSIGPHLRAIGYTREEIRAEARRIVSNVIRKGK